MKTAFLLAIVAVLIALVPITVLHPILAGLLTAVILLGSYCFYYAKVYGAMASIRLFLFEFFFGW